jgi:hypothetical protein
MRGIVFQEFEVFSGDLLTGFRQTRKESPEAGSGTMHLQVLESPLGLFVTGFAH